MTNTQASPWLLLIPQLPAKPAYLRVKVWRRLQAIGAAPLKNAVHALPNREDTRALFEELHREITENGGEALILEARLVGGMGDAATIAKGKKLFEEVGCLGCHVRDAKDDNPGPPLKGVNGRPLVYRNRDFAPALGNVGRKVQADWLVREITLYLKRTFKRIDVSSRSLIALIEPGSCFTGTLLELALAASADALIIGDKDLLVLGKTFAVPILTPAAFKARVSPS